MINNYRNILKRLSNGTFFSQIKKRKLNYKFKRLINSNRNFIIKKHPLNFKIKLYKDSVLSRGIYLEEFENNELLFVKKHLKKGDVFVDIGANIGLFSLLASKIIGNKGRIYSFEPTSDTYTRLCENISLNHSKNITPINKALSNENSKLNINKCTEGYDAWNSLVKPSANVLYETESITAIKATDFIKEEKINIEKIKLIKIDVEGWELNVLKGFDNLLNLPNSPDLLVEFTEENAKNAGITCNDLFDYISKTLKYNIYIINKNQSLTNAENIDPYLFKYINLFCTKKKNEII